MVFDIIRKRSPKITTERRWFSWSSTLLCKAGCAVPVSLRDAGKKFLIKFVQSHRKIALKTVLGCTWKTGILLNVSFISLLTRSNLRTNSNGYLFSFGLLISFYGNSMPQSMLKRHNSYMPQQHSRRFSSISALAYVHSRTFCNFPLLCCGGLHFQKIRCLSFDSSMFFRLLSVHQVWFSSASLCKSISKSM